MGAMARRVIKKEPTALRPAMARHIKALGLADAPAYLRWCAGAGFEASLEKSTDQRAEELERVQARAEAAAARARLQGNPRTLIEKACRGEIVEAQVDRPQWRAIVGAITRSDSQTQARRSLEAPLLHLERVAKPLVFDQAENAPQPTSALYLGGVIRLHQRRAQWRRDPLAWRPESHNSYRQFGALARYLLADYDTPGFLDSAWLRHDQETYRDWFIHIGQGGNMRDAATPYPFTKMIAHHFVNAPDDMTIEGAMMLADIQALGGGRRLASALMATRLGQSVERDPARRAFWLSVYRFFIANPMLALRHAGPIVDILAAQKFEPQRVMVGPGEVQIRPPPQPNLVMTRRTPQALLRQVEAWHGELRILRANDKRFWMSSGLKPFSVRTGPADRPEDQWHWRIRELLSGQELIEEGKRLRHCVSSYADSCSRAACSIWTLERRSGGDPSQRGEKLLTLEVDARRQLVQARGLQNRLPTAQEKNVVTAWMREAGIARGPYLYGW